MTWPLGFKLAVLVVVVAVALFGHYIPAWLLRRRRARVNGHIVAYQKETTFGVTPSGATALRTRGDAFAASCKFDVVHRSDGAVEQLRSVQDAEVLFYSITYSDTPWWTQAMQEIRRVHRLEAEIFAYAGGGPAVPQ